MQKVMRKLMQHIAPPQCAAIIVSLLLLGSVSAHAANAVHANGYDSHYLSPLADSRLADKGDKGGKGDDGGDDDGDGEE